MADADAEMVSDFIDVQQSGQVGGRHEIPFEDIRHLRYAPLPAATRETIAEAPTSVAPARLASHLLLVHTPASVRCRHRASQWVGGRRPCVLSVSKMGAGQEDYYLGQVAGGGHEYYAERGESPGAWIGGGASDLNLGGVVSSDDLRAVLAGLDPTTGGRLGAANRKVPGFDLTFSAPKSVSLLWALGDDAVAAGVVAAHEAAVAEVVGYLEREAVVCRRGRDGVFQVATSGLVGAAFRHSTSRAGDPQLHTHLLVANLARTDDGRWGALDGRLLYRHQRTAGFLYQAALRHHLTARLGVRWSAAERGMAEIAGVERPVVRAFSRRRTQIEAALAALGATSARAAEVAALATRASKDPDVSVGELRVEWRERAAALGLTPDRLAEFAPGPRAPTAIAVDVEALGEVVVDEASTFDRRDVVRALAEAAGEGASVREIEVLSDWWLQDEARAVMVGAGQFGEIRYSTPALLADEDLILRAAAAPAAMVGRVMPTPVESALRARPHLGDDQVATVRALTRGGRAVDVVVGPAGAGKTAMLDAAREAWTKSGYAVIGAALAARAADELATGAGIPSTTLTRLLAELERTPLSRSSVVVVDEAGMVGTRTLAALTRHTTAAQAKLVLVGDPRQLPEIHAGGAFAHLTRQPTAIHLTENRRQTDPIERAALDHLRNRRTRSAMRLFDQHGNVRRERTLDQVVARMVHDWHQHHAAGGDALMVAPRRWQVDLLNAVARHHLQQQGDLPADQLVVDDVGYSEGDTVVCLRNNPRFGVTNGTRGTLTHIHPNRGGITLTTRRGDRIHLPADYLEAGHLTHGYAATIHKAQGATIDHALVLATEELGQQGGYTALSRGRHTNHLYTVAGDERHAADRDLLNALHLDQTKSLARDHHRGPDVGLGW